MFSPREGSIEGRLVRSCAVSVEKMGSMPQTANVQYSKCCFETVDRLSGKITGTAVYEYRTVACHTSAPWSHIPDKSSVHHFSFPQSGAEKINCMKQTVSLHLENV